MAWSCLLKRFCCFFISYHPFMTLCLGIVSKTLHPGCCDIFFKKYINLRKHLWWKFCFFVKLKISTSSSTTKTFNYSHRLDLFIRSSDFNSRLRFLENMNQKQKLLHISIWTSNKPLFSHYYWPIYSPWFLYKMNHYAGKRIFSLTL